MRWQAIVHAAVLSAGLVACSPALAPVVELGSPATALPAAIATPVHPTPGAVTPTLTPSTVLAPAPGGGGPAPQSPAAPATPAGPIPTPTHPPDPPPVAGVSAAAFVVLDAATGAVLSEYHAHDRRSPASLTKIMTALVVLERSADLAAVVTVPEAVTALRASTLMGVPPGERVTVRDLLYGLLLPSGNDAAVALATHVAGSEPAFVALMNQRARELGLRDTQFTNSHGLDFRDWGSPYTSAYDLAVMTQAAVSNATFRQIVATRSYVAPGERAAYPMQNLNTLLGGYAGADGVKIGWTRRAGNTIAASAARGGRRIITVALGSTNRNGDARLLLDVGFAAGS